MILTFDIGGTRIKAARRNKGRLVPLGDATTPVDNFESFVRVLAGFQAEGDIGSAISIAGAVDPQSGRITVANIPCLTGRLLAQDLTAALGLPVLVLNDADCFALAEAAHGAGRGHHVVFGVILGTGVGGGVVIGGQVLAGAGEWGHGPVIETPALSCGCGQIGCLDTIGGGQGLARLHRHETGQNLTAPQIVQAWQEGRDAGTVNLWLEKVSGPLAMVVNVLGANVVPVGGGLSNAAALIAALDAATRARILQSTQGPLVVQAACGPDAGLIGAAEAGVQMFYRGDHAA